MNCLNFVKVGKVKVPKGSETFLMVSKKKKCVLLANNASENTFS